MPHHWEGPSNVRHDDYRLFATREEKLTMKQARQDKRDMEQARSAQQRVAIEDVDSDDDVAIFGQPRRLAKRI